LGRVLETFIEIKNVTRIVSHASNSEKFIFSVVSIIVLYIAATYFTVLLF
jgi:hypothetical protein